MPERLATGEPVKLTTARREAIAELVDEISDGHSVRLALVFGPLGVGKTSYLLSAGRSLHDLGHNIVFCNADGHGVERTASLTGAAPELEPLLADTDSGRRLVIVVDDAQGLDRDSVDLLEFIDRSPGHKQVALILSVVDPDELSVPLRRSLLRPDARYLMLEPMGQQEVADLVVQYFRDSTAPVRRALVADLMRRSDGLPAVIEALLPMVNPATFTIDDPDPPGSDAIESSIASANRFVDEGSYREAVERLTALNRIEGLRLNAETRRLLATSLYQMGALPEADRIRKGLVSEALMSDDHEVAFAAAMIGLPNAEAIDGDQGRLEGLLGVHEERLPSNVRHRHAVATSHEALQAGRLDMARYWLRQAEQLAGSPGQRAATAHLNWHLSTTTDHPADRARRLTAILEEGDLSPRWEALLHEIRAIDHFEAGLADESIADFGVLGAYAERVNDPLRTWHHLMFQTTVLFDAGRWRRAEEIRTEAMVFAVEHAIVGGEGLYVAQHFHRAWVMGQHAALVAMFPNIPPEIGKTRFGLAGWAETLRAAGEIDRAVAVGAPLVDQLLSGPQYSRCGLVAFMARFIAETSSADSVARAAQVLSARSGTAVMLGAGLSSLGPVDRYLFQLTGDTAHLDRAIAFADRADYRLWRVLLRIEHPDYEPGGAGLLSRQARNLATGTELELLL